MDTARNTHRGIVASRGGFAGLAALLVAAVILFGWKGGDRTATGPEASSARAVTPGEGPLRVGHTDSPLLGMLYAACERQEAPGKGRGLDLVRFHTGGDIGYALLAGEVDAGFVETEKALKLLSAPGGEGLRIAGAVKFPYGATLVVRKDLRIRLGDLPGMRVAAREPDCELLHRFETDSRRLGVDFDRIRVAFMPFSAMLPALEAGAIDAALLKGSHAVLAEGQGHKVLYQNWDVEAGDDCCPAVLAQTEYFLVVRDGGRGFLADLIGALNEAGALPPADLRQAVLRKNRYPAEALERFPVAWFAAVDEDLRRELGERSCALP